MPLHPSEKQRRREVVTTFVTAALTGDLRRFLHNLCGVDWSGAWLEIFQELVPIGRVHPAIKPVFLHAWRGRDDWTTNAPIGIDWTLTKDLDGHLDLLIEAFKILLTLTKGDRVPHLLYRGQALTEHEAGRYGVWWTPDPVYAESFARSNIRQHNGPGVVVAAFNPFGSILCCLNRKEFLVDPRTLTDIHVIDMPPAYIPHEEEVPHKQVTRLLGLPDGYWGDDILRWIEIGMPIEGLPVWRETRSEVLARERAEKDWPPPAPPLSPTGTNGSPTIPINSQA